MVDINQEQIEEVNLNLDQIASQSFTPSPGFSIYADIDSSEKLKHTLQTVENSYHKFILEKMTSSCIYTG